MKKKWQHIFSQSACPPIEDLKLYALGSLPKKEKVRIETHLAGCEMCNDVIEGYQALGNDKKLASAEAEITSRIETLLFKTKKKNRGIIYFKRIAAAASILIVGGLSVYFLFIQKPTSNPVAVKTEKPTEKKDTQGDTLLIARNEPRTPKDEAHVKNITQTETVDETSDAILHPATDISVETVPEKEIAAEVEPLLKTEEITAQPAFSKRAFAVKPDKAQIPLSSGKYLITGKVSDATTGESLIGVNVIVKGTTTGVVTDTDGRFQIQVPDSQAVLSFSYIGFINEEVKVDPGKETAIAMLADIKKLDEVVVVGYGAQKKESVTGAVSSITLEQENQYNRTEDLQKQIATLKQKLTASPNDRALWMKLSQKYIQIQDEYQAIEALQKVKQLSAPPTRTELDEVIELVKQKSYFKAQRRLKKIE